MHLKNSQSCLALRHRNENSDEESDDLSPFQSLNSSNDAGATVSDDKLTSAINLLDDMSNDSVLAQPTLEDAHALHVRKNSAQIFW